MTSSNILIQISEESKSDEAGEFGGIPIRLSYKIASILRGAASDIVRTVARIDNVMSSQRNFVFTNQRTLIHNQFSKVLIYHSVKNPSCALVLAERRSAMLYAIISIFKEIFEDGRFDAIDMEDIVACCWCGYTDAADEYLNMYWPASEVQRLLDTSCSYTYFGIFDGSYDYTGDIYVFDPEKHKDPFIAELLRSYYPPELKNSVDETPFPYSDI